ncbi:hypothetical protein F503_02096 [Ophiostoma piceae UAMH 11346]|uniref:Essential protein Yae1 N-terminal domain-containing protein n=1 Tax=Ophiostoma piceae (strain UAMH 11346) TaxID=1262450 RepID=S3BXT3_OPHP1|nr:hypothetical protein F503_02096 [Ophiostoma piceae UAMH 11346]
MDPFDDLFNLEDRFYDEGFQEGEADGRRAGLIEGRTLGLENGFKKFAEAGRLQGKAVMWANQFSGTRNARAKKNLRLMYALVEPGTLSTANTDEDVNDFDDRVKRAQGKARVIEKMLGEAAAGLATSNGAGSTSTGGAGSSSAPASTAAAAPGASF